MGLKYVGSGFLPGVPARDLSDPEADLYGRDDLLRSGLYIEQAAEKIAIMKPSNKLRKMSASNKEESNE